MLGYKKIEGLTLAAMAVQLDLEPAAASLANFQPQSLSKKARPDIVMLDLDGRPEFPVEPFCRELRRCFGDALPILATTAARKFAVLSALLDAGISDCLPREVDEEVFQRKIKRWLGDAAAEQWATHFDDEEIPEDLMRAFSQTRSWRTLGDLAAIYPGAAPRKPAFRRMAPPDAGWRGVLMAEGIERFSPGRPQLYLRWSRLHLFRLPGREEYAVREKVVVRRAGPPVVAAVDRSGAPVGADAYALVPGNGIPAGFVACLLNSRLADFYFNRLLAAEIAGGHLRADVLRRLPVPDVSPEVMQELARTAGLLGHFGINPQSWIDRQRRDELVDVMEERIFALYGLDEAAREELSVLHF